MNKELVTKMMRLYQFLLSEDQILQFGDLVVSYG